MIIVISKLMSMPIANLLSVVDDEPEFVPPQEKNQEHDYAETPERLPTSRRVECEPSEEETDYVYYPEQKSDTHFTTLLSRPRLYRCRLQPVRHAGI